MSWEKREKKHYNKKWESKNIAHEDDDHDYDYLLVPFTLFLLYIFLCFKARKTPNLRQKI